MKPNSSYSNFLALLLISGLLPVLLMGCDKGESPEEEEIIVTTSSRSFSLGSHTLTGIVSNDRGITVIYESGLGGDASVWGPVLAAVGKVNRGLAYNRGGYATSEAGPEPRDLVRLSDELHSVKQMISPNDKVVLVGHSWGGAIVRTYAIRFPEHVQGIVFVDPSHENELILTQAQEDDIAAGYAGQPGAQKESQQLIEGVNYLRTLPNLPDIPITVITNSASGSTSDWAGYHRSLGRGVSNFTQLYTTSGHNIQINEPDLVTRVINELIEGL